MIHQKTALVCGAGGFIGHHLVNRLKSDGYYVVGVDLKRPEYEPSQADQFLTYDLRDPLLVSLCMFAPKQSTEKNDVNSFDEVYQLAADMGGAGFVFTGEHDADIIHNSALINLNVAYYAARFGVKKLFYSSSACMYPQEKQTETEVCSLKESDAYPANPDSVYGWEKLFSEILYQSFSRNKNLPIRIARFHNIYGPKGTYKGGREKAPAAMCRKVIESSDFIEVWGDGSQARSFLYIDDCIDAIRLLMQSDFTGPVNIGSEEMITINGLAQLAMFIGNKDLRIKNIPGPLGVRGRNSDNTLIEEKLHWKPKYSLMEGLGKTYHWIENQIKHAH
jgi:nucleoside-diphosphate-sugar epimerase